MSRQLWGCYAVNDHLGPRPFVGDVLLYERLVIPVPPDDDPEALKPWRKWDPQRQSLLLKILEGRVMRVPWSSRLRQDFHQEFQQDWSASLAALDVTYAADHARGAHLGGVSPEAAHVTRALLSREITEKVFDHRDALALAVYADPLRFDAEWRLEWRPPFLRRYRRVRTERPRYEVEKSVDPEDYRLSKLLVAKFAIPENSRRSDEDMLKEVVDLAARPDMATWRRSFHDWVADMAPRSLTDATIAREMAELVADYNAAVKRKKRATITKASATVIGTGMSVGAACWAPLAIPAKAPISAVGNVIADRVSGDQREGGIAAAALLAEAAKRLR